MHPYVMYFWVEAISIPYQCISLHLSDFIAVPVHYWLYPILLSLLIFVVVLNF